MRSDAARSQLEAELEAFREHCRRAGFSAREMAKICSPLGAAASRASLRRRARALLACAAAVAIACAAWCAVGGVVDADRLSWHASAVGRVLLVRLLPMWDWRPLFHERCLVRAPPPPLDKEAPSTVLRPEDCATCEAVNSIPHVSSTSYDEILNRHLIRGAPVIVTDANADWPPSSADLNLTRALSSEEERLRDSVPCFLETNVRQGRRHDLNAVLARIAPVRSWFVHFQNCDLRAVKSLRALAPRPYFLSPHVPPAHFNWLLAAERYAAPRFKPLELEPGLIVLAQLRGGNSIRLEPRAPCERSCPTLSFDVRQGETLVLANSMWNFEYSPVENSHNVAVLTETAWDEA